jgi:hypothetical protein
VVASDTRLSTAQKDVLKNFKREVGKTKWEYIKVAGVDWLIRLPGHTLQHLVGLWDNLIVMPRVKGMFQSCNGRTENFAALKSIQSKNRSLVGRT